MFLFLFFLFVSVNLGIISTIANKFGASIMPGTVETGSCKWTTCWSPISIGMFGWCSRMLWTIVASSSFTFIVRRDGRLQHTTMCCSSTIRDESRRTKRMRMWCQFGTTSIHTGNDLIFTLYAFFRSFVRWFFWWYTLLFFILYVFRSQVLFNLISASCTFQSHLAKKAFSLVLVFFVHHKLVIWIKIFYSL